MARKNIYELPVEFVTWKDYCDYLISNLSEDIRNNYKKMFEKSINFWHNVGGGFTDEEIFLLKEKGYLIEENGLSPRSKRKLTRIIFVNEIPDSTEDLHIVLARIPSYRRNAICILKSDFGGKTLGF